MLCGHTLDNNCQWFREFYFNGVCNKNGVVDDISMRYLVDKVNNTIYTHSVF